MDELPPMPNFLKRTKETPMTAPEKKTRQPRMTPAQKARFHISAEIALIDKKLEGVEALQRRKEQLAAALEAMPGE